jgi:hypothetical protein
MGSNNPHPFASKKNDLVMVSTVMLLLLIFAVGAEDPGLESRLPDITDGGDQGPQDGEDNKTKSTFEVEILSISEFTAEGGSTDVDMDFEQENALEINIVLEWSDDIGSNDEFKLTLSNSSGEVDSDQGSSGSLSIRYSPGSGMSLVDKYTITVEAVDCPGIVGIVPVDRDGGNDWTLTTTAVVEEF